MLPADRLRPVLRGDQRRTGSPGAPTRVVNRDDGAQSWFFAARSRCVPLPATRARVWWLASASGSSFPSADVRAPACGFGRVQPGLARRRRALEKARPESCHRLGQTRASDSRAVNRSTASGPVVIQHVGADLSTYWARTEQPLQKRHTQPLHGPDFVPYRRHCARSSWPLYH
jgi:hypothetical protein